MDPVPSESKEASASPPTSSHSLFGQLGDAVPVPDDLYDRIVQQVSELSQSMDAFRVDIDEHDSTVAPFSNWGDEPQLSVEAPRVPSSLEDAGLSSQQVTQLVLKFIYLNGSSSGYDLAKQLRLPFTAIEDLLLFLKSERQLEVSQGETVGPLSYRYLLTDQGRSRAREAFEECRYVGPAPVSLADYLQQCRRQSVARVNCTPEALRVALKDLVASEKLIQSLGPAVCSGQAVFLWGAPGNGKTSVAKGIGRFLNRDGGDIYVPYAVAVDSQIITVFDPTVHHAVDSSELSLGGEEAGPSIQSPEFDRRWRRVRRPVVICGGELTLEMLDLRFHQVSRFYTAPLHVKANGGVFLLDDFGRQLVEPRELLNRWTIPLEEKVDYLTLSTGKSFSVPFESLVIFSTNLAPEDLVDDAFLRRIRHKIHLLPPNEEQYLQIFRRCCEERDIPFRSEPVRQLFAQRYNRQKLPRASDPRDLLDTLVSTCRFNRVSPVLDEQGLTDAFLKCLCDVGSGTAR